MQKTEKNKLKKNQPLSTKDVTLHMGCSLWMTIDLAGQRSSIRSNDLLSLHESYIYNHDMCSLTTEISLNLSTKKRIQ